MCGKGLMRHFIHGRYPGRIDITLKIRDEVTVDKLWDVERRSCLGRDCFHDSHDSLEIQAKVHKGMDANIEPLGWFWDSIRAMLQNNERITIREAIGKAQCTSI
jgi:hypothetical protein